MRPFRIIFFPCKNGRFNLPSNYKGGELSIIGYLFFNGGLASSKKLMGLHQFLYFLSFIISLNFDISSKYSKFSQDFQKSFNCLQTCKLLLHMWFGYKDSKNLCVCVCVCVCVFYKNKKQWVETMECGCLWVKRLRQWGRGGCYILPFNNNQIHKACVYVFIPSQDESCFSLFCPLKNSDFFHWICFAICWIPLRKKIKKCDFKAKFVQLLWNLKKSEYRVDNLIDQYFLKHIKA